MKAFFASESVTEGHPDKVCDKISDAVLDAVLTKDPRGRVACETLVKTGAVILAGEITTTCYVEFNDIVRSTLRDIGYNADTGFDAKTCAIIPMIQAQSPDIAKGVDTGGAGDQGLMFGYANTETPELMPMPIMLAHKLVRRLTDVRKDGTLTYLRPDGKSQVSIEYDNKKPVRVDTVILGAHHSHAISTKRLREDLEELVIKQVIPEEMLENTKMIINGTGRFEIGGPIADAGLTGRKIIVDTYGGYAPHGGGAFSGKDPSKVDRSAAYMARYIAKNIVKAGIATACEIQLSYCIGVAEPVSVNVKTFGTSQVDEEKISRAVREIFPLTPRGIIEELKLLRPIYTKTAAYGHFGRENEGFPWEETGKVVALFSLLG